MKSSSWIRDSPDMKAIIVSMFVVVGCAGIEPSPRTPLDIPVAVTSTVKHHAGTAKYTVHRDGEDRFEALWHDGDLEREAVVTRDGRLVELEIEIRAEDVPAAVRDTAKRVLGLGSTFKYVQLNHDRYEVGTMVHGREREVTIATSGAIVSGDEADGDDDDDGDGDGDDDVGREIQGE